MASEGGRVTRRAGPGPASDKTPPGGQKARIAWSIPPKVPSGRVPAAPAEALARAGEAWDGQGGLQARVGLPEAALATIELSIGGARGVPALVGPLLGARRARRELTAPASRPPRSIWPRFPRALLAAPPSGATDICRVAAFTAYFVSFSACLPPPLATTVSPGSHIGDCSEQGQSTAPDGGGLNPAHA